MQAYFAQREEQHSELRLLVEATMAGHHSTKEARAQLQAMKRNIGEETLSRVGGIGLGMSSCSPVQEVSTESRVLMARTLEEAEQEMRCRAELIQQIRAMERVPLVRTNFVDLTETGKRGLLVEMSIAEVMGRSGIGGVEG